MQLNELLLPAAWVKVPAGQLVHEPLPVLTEYVLKGHTVRAGPKAEGCESRLGCKRMRLSNVR